MHRETNTEELLSDGWEIKLPEPQKIEITEEQFDAAYEKWLHKHDKVNDFQVSLKKELGFK